MNVHRTLRSIYKKIKQQRFEKKWNIYKKVYSMSIDKTILIYALIALGYVVTSIVMSGDILHYIQRGFDFVEEIGRSNFWMIMSVYPLRYVFQSFRQPGIVFSSSEYQLSILPYGLRNIWHVIVVEKWIKRIVLGSILWLILLVTPLSNTLTGAYIFSFVVFDICMTIPLWKLYQKRWITKFISFISGMIGLGLFVWIQPIIAAIVVIIAVLAWNLFAWKNVMKNVEWGKVTEVSDMKVWKMPFISYVTKVPFKRKKRFYVLQHMGFRRKRFSYQSASIHHRLWHSYIIKNGRTLFQLLGILLVFLVAMAIVQEFVFYLGIAIAIYIFSKMSASLFYDRFKSDILEVLPWDLHVFRKTFFRWNIYGGLLLICPVIIYYIVHFSWWAPLHILLTISVWAYVLQNELERASVLLGKQTKTFLATDVICVIGFISIIFSGTYPAVTLFAILYGFLIRRKNQLSKV